MFQNREDAGKKLAGLLTEYKDKNVLVLGIPRGGVEIAWHVAKHLNAELSVIISKKLPYPGHEEYGFGAISEQSEVYVDEERVPDDAGKVRKIAEEMGQEILRRIAIYRANKPLPGMKDRIVILVDDGIATGVTLVPVLRLCKKNKAAKVIIAAPVAGRDYDRHLREADEIKVLYQPSFFVGVGQAYEDFGQLRDSDVLRFLNNYHYTNHENGKS